MCQDGATSLGDSEEDSEAGSVEKCTPTHAKIEDLFDLPKPVFRGSGICFVLARSPIFFNVEPTNSRHCKHTRDRAKVLVITDLSGNYCYQCV